MQKLEFRLKNQDGTLKNKVSGMLLPRQLKETVKLPTIEVAPQKIKITDNGQVSWPAGIRNLKLIT